jgi:uncharacterized protein DUF5670
MGLIELIIVVLVIMWLLGYFGRGRWYATGPSVSTAGWSNNSLIHLLLVLAVILIILRILGVA